MESNRVAESKGLVMRRGVRAWYIASTSRGRADRCNRASASDHRLLSLFISALTEFRPPAGKGLLFLVKGELWEGGGDVDRTRDRPRVQQAQPHAQGYVLGRLALCRAAEFQPPATSHQTYSSIDNNTHTRAPVSSQQQRTNRQPELGDRDGRPQGPGFLDF